jgi:GNAT superfamily N-acetyltransferase
VCIASRPTQGDELEPVPDGIRVREARQDELETIARLSSLEVEYNSRSPIFSQGGPPDLDAIRASHEELANQGAIHLLAELEGQRVGLLTLAIESRFAPICSENGLFVGPTATDPRFRRRGIASALLASALDWARCHGYPQIDVSFRSANLLSRRFWHRTGFVTIGWQVARRLPDTVVGTGER